jgi:hypothetical protein
MGTDVTMTIGAPSPTDPSMSTNDHDKDRK